MMLSRSIVQKTRCFPLSRVNFSELLGSLERALDNDKQKLGQRFGESFEAEVRVMAKGSGYIPLVHYKTDDADKSIETGPTKITHGLLSSEQSFEFDALLLGDSRCFEEFQALAKKSFVDNIIGGNF